MRPSLSRLYPLPPPQPPSPRARPPLSEPEVTRLWYMKYRPWLLTISVGIVVAGGALFGAELKTEWQRRKVRELRALEKAGEGVSAARGGSVGVLQEAEASLLRNKTGEVREGIADTKTTQGSTAKEGQAQAQTQVLSERELQTRNKKIQEYVENLEARKKELLMKKDEIGVKVQKLQERMRRKEEQERERERVGRGGGTIARVKR